LTSLFAELIPLLNELTSTSNFTLGIFSHPYSWQASVVLIHIIKIIQDFPWLHFVYLAFVKSGYFTIGDYLPVI